MIGGLVAAGVPPWFMVAHSAGETFEGVSGADGRPAAEADRSGGAVFRLHRGLPPLGPGSWRLALSSLAAPRRHTPLALTVGWLPRGFISTEALERTIRRVVPSGWVGHESFWAVACDYADGHRVPFGARGLAARRHGQGRGGLVRHPRLLPPGSDRLGALRRRWSAVRLQPRPPGRPRPRPSDLPQSHFHAERAASTGGSSTDPAQAMRAANGRRLGHEAKRVRAGGTEVVLIQPVAEDLAVMGSNLMNGRRRHEVIETAVRTVTEAAREARACATRCARLPKGEPHKVRKPAGRPFDVARAGARVASPGRLSPGASDLSPARSDERHSPACETAGADGRGAARDATAAGVGVAQRRERGR